MTGCRDECESVASAAAQPTHQLKVKGKGKGPVLDIALLHDEHMLRNALQSRKWQLIGIR